MLTDGEEGGVGDASLSAGDICGGVEESSEETRGVASSESPEGGNRRDVINRLHMQRHLVQK